MTHAESSITDGPLNIIEIPENPTITFITHSITFEAGALKLKIDARYLTDNMATLTFQDPSTGETYATYKKAEA